MVRRWLVTIATCLMVAAVRPGAAQAPEDPAVSLARAAEVMMKEGRLDEAAALFQKAYDLDPAPTLLYNIGRVYDLKGDLARARDYYERFLAHEKDPERLARGRQRLEAVLDRTPGRIVVTTDPLDASVAVDGAAVPRQGTEAMAEVRRGSHRVRVEREGFLAFEEDAVVQPGGEVRLFAKLVRVDDAKLVRVDEEPAVTPPVGSEVPGGTARARRFAPWQWVAIGSGAGMVVTGAILHGLAARGWADVAGAATHPDGTIRYESMTRTEAIERQRAADLKMDIAIGLYAAGGAAIATGVVLWVLDGATGGSTAAPVLGPGPGEGGITAIWRF